MWESPIKITENIKRQMDMEIENGIMTAVREIGIVVNKEELLKALQYDRGQYEKGYQDGVTDTNVDGKWILCSEKMPDKEYELYWTTHEDGSIVLHGYTKKNGFIYNWEVDDLELRKRQCGVVAWMLIPMPEPYKGE